jgi:hypothetical protein
MTMKKFIVIYYAPAAAMAQMANATPEDMQKGMEAWMTWAKQCGDGLVDLGTPLIGGQKVGPSGSSPSDKEVSGYSILQAASMDDAKTMLQGHPHLGWAEGCAIEIYESMPLPA